MNRRSLEVPAVLVACLAASVWISWRLLQPNIYSDDAFVHQYWMWHFRDPGLFNDPLTQDLRNSGRYPPGYVGLFWVATQFMNPIEFGELLGVGLMAVTAWLIFLIVREHTEWKPGAWIAAALFLSLLDINRFNGGFQRAFIQPAVLLVVLLAMRRKEIWAAVVAGGIALIYPPAALLTGGTLGLSALRRRSIDRPRLLAAIGAVVLAAIAVGIPLALGSGDGSPISRAFARMYPDFGPQGPVHYFSNSLLVYLRSNRSGFNLRTTGSLLLIVAAALLLATRANRHLLRREVAWLPVISLLGYLAAQLVLFQLYLPHRYTYPLVLWGAIAVGVALKPTWDAFGTRPLGIWALLLAPGVAFVLASYVFPLGPMNDLGELVTAKHALAALALAAVAGGVAFGLRRLPSATTIGGIITGVTLVVILVAVGDGPRGNGCYQSKAVTFISKLPKNAIIAGDPVDLKCIPGTAKRAVVISNQLAPSYEKGYFLRARNRMFNTLAAYYGQDPKAIVRLADRYKATDLWVRRDTIRKVMDTKIVRWLKWMRPYGRYVRSLLAKGRPATLSLPERCARFDNGTEAVYDIGCLRTAA